MNKLEHLGISPLRILIRLLNLDRQITQLKHLHGLLGSKLQRPHQRIHLPVGSLGNRISPGRNVFEHQGPVTGNICKHAACTRQATVQVNLVGRRIEIGIRQRAVDGLRRFAVPVILIGVIIPFILRPQGKPLLIHGSNKKKMSGRQIQKGLMRHRRKTGRSRHLISLFLLAGLPLHPRHDAPAQFIPIPGILIHLREQGVCRPQ